MSIKRTGFTLIEITLFLAITGLLFVGIIAGTGNSLAEQRFNDSVQSFAELLRSVYSQVSNPQSIGHGRSDKAIYGKLISFGQSVGLDGEDLDVLDQTIFIYDVVGKVDELGDKNINRNALNSSIQTILDSLDVNVLIETGINNGKAVVEPAGEVEVYLPRWMASIETTSKNADKNLYKGSILVVRHPRSGTINTLVWDETVQANLVLKEYESNERSINDVRGLLKSVLSNFTTKEVDFCVNPNGAGTLNPDRRRDIRLVNNARNASGVEVIDLDLNKVEGANQIGNRCRF